MEFWNNVWTAISTPNPMLTSILLIPMIFVENLLMFLLIVHTFNIDYTKKQRNIYVLLISILGLIIGFAVPYPFNTILDYSAIFIVLFILFRMSIFKTLVATIFPIIVFNLIGYLVNKPYLALLHTTYDQVNSIYIYRLPIVLLNYSLAFFVIEMIKHRQLVIDVFENLDKKNRIIILINFLFGLFCILVQGILSVKYIDMIPLAFSIFNFICLLIYFVLSLFTVTKISKLISTKERLESSEAYNKSLHVLHDSVRGFKHDFDNIVTTIGGYIKTEDMEGLKNYYAQLVEDSGRVNNLYILNPNVVNNPGIYNLLTAKYSEAEELGLKVSLTFLMDLENLSIKIYDFARILGILLDNAIEASSESKEKELNIVFRNEDKNNRNIVLIENTYSNKDVDIKKIFEKENTSKDNHSGLGLWEVNKLLKKNNNVNLHTEKTDKYFSQKLEIYY